MSVCVLACNLDRRQIEFQQAHVLNDQRVGTGVVDLPDQPAGVFEFIVP